VIFFQRGFFVGGGVLVKALLICVVNLTVNTSRIQEFSCKR
jgi:hypothetical protein